MPTMAGCGLRSEGRIAACRKALLQSRHAFPEGVGNSVGLLQGGVEAGDYCFFFEHALQALGGSSVQPSIAFLAFVYS